MKNNLSRLFLISSDILAIYLSILFAYMLVVFIESTYIVADNGLVQYTDKLLVYVVILAILFYEGIYTKRYDFWHESRQVITSLIYSFLIVMSYLAIVDKSSEFENIIIIVSFIFMAFFIPLFKNILKKKLYKWGIWRCEAKIYGNDEFLTKEIFTNPYLGYVEAKDEKEIKTVFVNSQSLEVNELKKIIDREMHKSHELIFIPLVNEYNLTRSFIYELSNTRTNLIVFNNRLKSKTRLIIQQILNYLLAISLLPILLPIIGILAYLIKKESPGPVFFAHNRIGKDGKVIPTYKFRSMFQDAGERLEKLLKEDEAIKKEWEENFKLKDDPRVTKIGDIFRKTSLDELPQLFNVLKGEMNFVGPRPVIQKELDMYYKDDIQYYYMVKPGITGLWQVSGRSDTDYDFRVSTDKWYVQNWSLWLDVVILFKTVKVVLFREGAY